MARIDGGGTNEQNKPMKGEGLFLKKSLGRRKTSKVGGMFEATFMGVYEIDKNGKLKLQRGGTGGTSWGGGGWVAEKSRLLKSTSKSVARKPKPMYRSKL